MLCGSVGVSGLLPALLVYFGALIAVSAAVVAVCEARGSTPDFFLKTSSVFSEGIFAQILVSPGLSAHSSSLSCGH